MAVFPSTMSDCIMEDANNGVCSADQCDPLNCVEDLECLNDDDSDGVPNANDYCDCLSCSPVNKYGCPLPKMDKFDDDEVNSNLTYEDLGEVDDFTIGKKNKIKVKFTNRMNLTKNDGEGYERFDFDESIDYSDGRDL